MIGMHLQILLILGRFLNAFSTFADCAASTGAWFGCFKFQENTFLWNCFFRTY